MGCQSSSEEREGEFGWVCLFVSVCVRVRVCRVKKKQSVHNCVCVQIFYPPPAPLYPVPYSVGSQH